MSMRDVPKPEPRTGTTGRPLTEGVKVASLEEVEAERLRWDEQNVEFTPEQAAIIKREFGMLRD